MDICCPFRIVYVRYNRNATRTAKVYIPYKVPLLSSNISYKYVGSNFFSRNNRVITIFLSKNHSRLFRTHISLKI